MKAMSNFFIFLGIISILGILIGVNLIGIKYINDNLQDVTQDDLSTLVHLVLLCIFSFCLSSMFKDIDKYIKK